jgi:hypothetical protein
MPDPVTGTVAALGGGSLISGVLGSKDAKKSQAAANDLNAQQLAMMQEQIDNFKALIAELPKQSQEYMSKIAASHAMLSTMLEEAKAQGDTQAAQAFQSQRDLVESHFTAESEAIGLNTQDMLNSIDDISNKTLEMVNADEDIKDRIRGEYKKEADKAVGNLSKMAEMSGQRIDNILKTGLPEGAAANISRISQGVADLKRKTMEFESARGKGGAASRGTAVDLEGLKMIGETTANLRAQARNELAQEGQIQGQLQQAAGERMTRLKPTRTESALAYTQPYQMAKLDVKQQGGQQQLTALGNKNVQIRNLTSAEGDASLAREQEFAQTKMGMAQSRTAQEMGVMEREQDLTGAYTGQQAGQARSMADIMGVQAQNYSNMAMQSRAQATAAYGQAAKIGVGAMAGASGAFGTDVTAAQGALFTGMGIAPASYMRSLYPTTGKA